MVRREGRGGGEERRVGAKLFTRVRSHVEEIIFKWNLFVKRNLCIFIFYSGDYSHLNFVEFEDAKVKHPRENTNPSIVLQGFLFKLHGFHFIESLEQYFCSHRLVASLSVADETFKSDMIFVYWIVSEQPGFQSRTFLPVCLRNIHC